MEKNLSTHSQWDFIEKRLESFEKLQRSDHDTLIELRSSVNNVMVTLNKLADGTAVQLVDLEKRVSLLEKMRDEIKPEELRKEHNELVLWRHDAKTIYRTGLAIASVVSSALTLAISLGVKFL